MHNTSHSIPLVLSAAAFCSVTAVPITQSVAAEPTLVFPVPSTPATLKQRIGITDVEIDYSRPDKNGREIFGQLVPLGEVWRTGANACTKLVFSGPVKLGGKEVPAGRYGLFTIPGVNEWTIILSKNAEQWGSSSYKAVDDLVRLIVRPETLTSSVETFTIGLTDVHEDGAQLCLTWDRARVRVPLSVDTVAETKAEIARVDAANEATPKFYAQAAAYYLSHHLGEVQTLAWINASIEAMGLPGKEALTPPAAPSPTSAGGR